MTGSIATGRRAWFRRGIGSVRRQAGSALAGAGALAIVLSMPGTVQAQNPGPDVIVGSLPDVRRWGVVGNITAYSVATTSCNIGDARLNWFSGTNQHPVIGQNMYRLKDGRFEQIGMSWLKHGFFALSQSLCEPCNDPTGGTQLGVGCSDPYGAGLNGSQGGLGPRSEVNASTGFFLYPFGSQGASGNAIYKRLQVHNADLDPGLNAGAQYFVEGHYVTPDDAAVGNHNNNASYRAINVTGTPGSGTYNISLTGPTVREMPAIQAWKVADPAVVIRPVDDQNGGRFIVGAKATPDPLVPGNWHYEYAVHNLNSHRSARSFSIPVGAGVTVTNVGFHDVDYHSGDGNVINTNYDGTNWSSTVTANAVTWQTQTEAQNPNANALRWGTLYNFRFDADSGPTNCGATLGMYRSGMSDEFTSKIVPVPKSTPVTMPITPTGVYALGGPTVDLTMTPMVFIVGNSGNITVEQLACDPHPSAPGVFRSLGTTLDINTTLPVGTFRMVVSIPFDGTGLNLHTNADMRRVALSFFSPMTSSYEFWYFGNDPPTLGPHRCFRTPASLPTPDFTTLLSIPACAPVDIGDGGLYYDFTTERGFAWGLVNHTTEFTTAISDCTCFGDANGDGRRDGEDVQRFIECLIGVGSDCACAGVDVVPGVGIGDITEFVNELLAGTACP